MQIGGASSLNLIGGTSQTGASQGLFSSKAKEPTGVEAEFLKHARMSVAEQMRARLLKQLGLTEDEVKAMSPEERDAVETKLREMIKTQVQRSTEEKKGALVDIKA